MISKIINIHGSSSEVTFDCVDFRVKASGEFFSEDGKIAGFVVSKASLKYEDGKWLTADEQEELIRQYEEYVSRPDIQKNWLLRFE